MKFVLYCFLAVASIASNLVYENEATRLALARKIKGEVNLRINNANRAMN